MVASAVAGQRPRILRSKAGFTMIEAVVAIAVVTIGLMGVFQVLGSTIGTNVDARNRSFATHFAERRLEAVRNEDFDYVDDTADNSDPDLTRSLGPSATWSLNVTPINANLKGVTITVEWTQNGYEQSIALNTLAHRAGIATIRNRYAN